MSTINERIAEIITLLGISKTSFSKELKVSQQYISKLTKQELLVIYWSIVSVKNLM